ncbi:MAG: DUF4297 domain-containing protein [Tepidibacter sp.]|jgi:hypothetical protein|uniref:dsDNA nuclease domain-containing protein n=1 Tax=Tepidibacter sp. TaxID=2529387 RepID=UPI0025FF0239|nr:dsDNA nuclease domain-containing protein [Tepidibacter sp.]MCT4508644.1 DUF4297 domain-containing protein [Tepidibacter sp.]
MLDNAIIEKIQSMPDSEKGGDNALDGFEFQVSSAVYLMFKEIENKNKCALIYEKVEDFIIFTDEIQLYQAKSINRNLTPNVLYSSQKKTKQNESTLSIIEKMNNNYSSIKEVFPSHSVYNNLVICENQTFSKKLSKDCKDLKVLNFDLLKEEAKRDIINNTTIKKYDWSNMRAIRLIPKNRHEEVTRIFIEDVIKNIMGENKINSLALYNTLTNEIRKIRKNKTKLTSEFVMDKINKFASFEEDLEYRNYVHFLNDEDGKNFKICMNFNTFKNCIRINNDPSVQDYNSIRKYYRDNQFSNVYEVFESIKANQSFENMCLILDECEIKALILLVIAKEMN